MQFVLVVAFALSATALPTGPSKSIEKRDPQGLLGGLAAGVGGLVDGLLGSPRGYGPDVVVVPQPQPYGPPGIVVVGEGRGNGYGDRDDGYEYGYNKQVEDKAQENPAEATKPAQKRDPQGLLGGLAGAVDGLVGGLTGSSDDDDDVAVVPEYSPAYPPDVGAVPEDSQAYPPEVGVVDGSSEDGY